MQNLICLLLHINLRTLKTYQYLTSHTCPDMFSLAHKSTNLENIPIAYQPHISSEVKDTLEPLRCRSKAGEYHLSIMWPFKFSNEFLVTQSLPFKEDVFWLVFTRYECLQYGSIEKDFVAKDYETNS